MLACKQALRTTLEPKLRQQFSGAQGQALEQLPAYPAWSALNRAAQDRMWALPAEQIDRDYPRIEQQARLHTRNRRAALNWARRRCPPTSSKAAFTASRAATCWTAIPPPTPVATWRPASCTRPVNLYALGQGIGRKNSKAQRLINHLGETYPDLQPAAHTGDGLLSGGQSTDYPDAFPAAEVWAIDLSPGMLRYAHAPGRDTRRAGAFSPGRCC